MTDTMERIDPDLIRPDDDFGVAALELHLARYRFAAKHVLGRVVVDCACGTGYGSAMLADAGAAAVIGVDISEEAIAYAQAHHARDRVDFRVGDALTFVPERPAQVWVTLETVEHLLHPARYLDRIHQQLAPGGWLIASSTSRRRAGGRWSRHTASRSSMSWVKSNPLRFGTRCAGARQTARANAAASSHFIYVIPKWPGPGSLLR